MHRLTAILSATEGALVGVWIAAFSRTVGTPHAGWYFWLPFAFLALPAITAVASMLGWAKADSHDGARVLAICALVVNLVGFFGYAVMSGGGV